MMSTFRIFEELSQTMDPAAARKLAGVLDGFYADLKQSVTKADFDTLKAATGELAQAQQGLTAEVKALAQAQQRTEARVEELALAQQRTEARVEQLALAQQRTEARIEQLAQAQHRTEARVEQLVLAQERTEARVEQLAQAQQALAAEVKALAQAQQRTEARIEQLAQAQERTEVMLRGLVEQVRVLTGHVGVYEQRLAKLDERTLEMLFRDKASGYLGTVLRRTRVVPVGDLGDALEGVLTPEEWAELTRSDVILRGRAELRGQRCDIYAAVEVSVTVEVPDVERAARRAALLRKKGWKAMAVAAGETVSEELVSLAAHRGVAVLEDGRQHNWSEALAAAN